MWHREPMATFFPISICSGFRKACVRADHGSRSALHDPARNDMNVVIVVHHSDEMEIGARIER